MKFVVICFNHKRCQKKSVEDTFISIVVTLTAIIRKPSNRYNSCFMCTPTLPVAGVQIGGRGGGGGAAGDCGKRFEHKKITTRGWGRGESPLFLLIFSSLSSFAPRPLSERLEQANNNNVACPTDRTRLIIRVRLRLLSRLQKRNISVLFCHLEVRKYSKLPVSCRTVVLISQLSRHI